MAVEALPGELEVVALHVDRPALVAHDVDAPVDAGDQLLGARAVGPGVRQRHVGHALYRARASASRRRRTRWSARSPSRPRWSGRAGSRRAIPSRTRSNDWAATPSLVDAHRGQAVLHRAVAGDVHDGGAVGERAELVEGGEGGPGVGRLVADGPVELGGVPDRLVDGEPEIRRVDDEVVGPACTEGACSFSASSSGSWASSASQSQFPADAGSGQELPTPPDRRRQRAHGLEAVSESASASSWDCRRTRCWVARVPLRSAR